MTEPTRPDRPAHHQWIVGCSPSRTLVARRLDADRAVLVKIYESGSPAEAAHELALGRRLRGEGVATHIETGVDPDTGRPCLIQELVPGRDLETLLADRGPLPAREAAAIARGIARVLARFAALRGPDAPAGFVHGDVKPSNVAVDGDATGPRVTLLDLEQAGPAPDGSSTQSPVFTGGTHGYAPPEAYEGVTPNHAFDVFGLGAVLHAALAGTPPFGDPGVGLERIERAVRTGQRRRWLLDGCPPAVLELVDACLDGVPERRPRAADVAARLDAWLATPPAPEVDEARQQSLRGRPAAVVQSAAPDLRARLARRARLLDAIPTPTSPPPDATIDSVVRDLPRTLRALDTFMLRFPLHPGARSARRQALAAAARVPFELPERIALLKRSARFAEALELCDRALDALRRVGRLPLREASRSMRPTPAERDPVKVLVMVRRDVASAAEAHEAVQARVRAAEAAADCGAVERAIGELATLYGGASPVVAAAKDQLHRLEFYLTRVGQQAALVDDLHELLGELGVPADLEPVERFRRGDAARGAGHPRSLLRALRDLVDAFPALERRAGPALAALGGALDAATRRAWELTDEAERMLLTPPIPIRPLTALLTRLDRSMQADVLVDLPGRARVELHDRIETVRTKIDQARAERDRITRGAQEAMDRGHLTTAIYDMARAVDRFGGEGATDPGLAEQFEEAKRRKRELEEALEENHAMAARYGDLAAEPGSTPAERLAVLHEREHVLTFLCANLGPERAAAYVEDLRGVQLDVLREQAADGERRLAAARDPEERLSIAQRTFDALQHAAPETGWAPAEVREARALVQHWLDMLEMATGEARDARQRHARTGHRRPRWRTAVALAVVLATATVLVATYLRGTYPVDRGAALRRALGDPVLLTSGPDGATAFEGAVSLARLREFVAELRASGATHALEDAARAVEAVDAVSRGASDFPAVAAAVAHLVAGAGGEEDEPTRQVLGTFAQRVLRAGFVLATLRAPSAELQRTLREDTQLRRSLSFEDAAVLERALSR